MSRTIRILLCLLVCAWVGWQVAPAWSETPEVVLVSKSRIMNAESLAKGIGPQEQVVMTNVDRWAPFGLKLELDRTAYRIGDLVRITIRADRDCHILVYYVDSRGKAAVICPSPFSKNNLVRAGKPFRLVDNTGRLLQETGPVGIECLQVVASDTPINVAKLHGIDMAAAIAATPASVPARKPSSAAAPPRKPVTTAPSRPAVYHPQAPPRAGSVATTQRPYKVRDPDEFTKSVEVDMRDRIVTRARLISSRHPQGVGPQTRFDKKDRCFAIDMVKYEVRP